MATLKEIFTQVSMMNPSVSTISSIGSFVDANSQQLADYVTKKIMGYLPMSSLAYKIALESMGHYSTKQMWVITYELQKNNEYCAILDKDLAEIAAREARRKANMRAKRNRRNERNKINK